MTKDPCRRFATKDPSRPRKAGVTRGFLFGEHPLKRQKICIVDGQGGGIGANLIKYLREFHGERYELLALGTNVIATSQMMKAGANRGASGENAVIHTVARADLIIGTIAVTWANAMLGEVTPAMAAAITSSPAPKILLPLFHENIILVCVGTDPLPHMVKSIVEDKILEILPHV